MKSSHRLDRKSISIFAAFLLLGGATVTAYRLAPTAQVYSFVVGPFTVYAQSYQGNGLYRDITFSEHTGSWFFRQKLNQTQAKYARYDPKKPGHLVLSIGSRCGYNKDGAIQFRTTFGRMVIDAK